MRRLIFASALTAILIVGFQNCARGTDTGNPDHSTSSTGSSAGQGSYSPSQLQNVICTKLAACAIVDSTGCMQAVYELPGLAAKFGASSLIASLKDLAGDESSSLDECNSELSALACSDPAVQGAYDSTNASPFAGVLAMIPQNGKCPLVYTGH